MPSVVCPSSTWASSWNRVLCGSGLIGLIAIDRSRANPKQLPSVCSIESVDAEVVEQPEYVEGRLSHRERADRIRRPAMPAKVWNDQCVVSRQSVEVAEYCRPGVTRAEEAV